MTTALLHGDCRRCDVKLRGCIDAAVVDGEHNNEQAEQRLSHLFLPSIAHHAFILGSLFYEHVSDQRKASLSH